MLSFPVLRDDTPGKLVDFPAIGGLRAITRIDDEIVRRGAPLLMNIRQTLWRISACSRASVRGFNRSAHWRRSGSSERSVQSLNIPQTV